MCQVTPEQAANDLLTLLQAPAGSVAITTLRRGLGPEQLALRVFFIPEVKHLRRLVPSSWEGFEVLCEIAEQPVAH